MAGDKSESDRLRKPFLAWIGKGSYAAALKAAGVEYGHGMNWLGRDGILRADYQVKVRVILYMADLLPDLLPGSAG